MAQKRIGKMVSWKLSEETISEIERIATKRDMTKSQVIRMCLEAGLGMHRDLEKVGIIRLLDTGTDFVRWCREAGLRHQRDQDQLVLPFPTK